MESVGKAKAEVTEETINSINPFVEVEALNQELTPKNVQSIVEGSDIVVDALDNLMARILTTRKAVELGIPFVHGAIHGTMFFLEPTYTYIFTFTFIKVRYVGFYIE